MRYFTLLVLLLIWIQIIIPVPALAGEKGHQHAHGDSHIHEHEPMLIQPENIQVSPHQAVIQVKGIVCSFCAYGTEKKLSVLDFLDKNQLDGKGLLTDIKSGQITMAIQPDKQINFHETYNAIKDGGYEPLSIHFLIEGKVLNSPQGPQIQAINGENYLITHPTDLNRSEGEIVSLQVHVHGDDIPAFQSNEPIPVMIDAKEV